MNTKKQPTHIALVYDPATKKTSHVPYRTLPGLMEAIWLSLPANFRPRPDKFLDITLLGDMRQGRYSLMLAYAIYQCGLFPVGQMVPFTFYPDAWAASLLTKQPDRMAGRKEAYA